MLAPERPTNRHTATRPRRGRSCRIVDRFLWRPPKYNEKYAPQELSLLFQLFRLGGGGDGGGGPPCDLVIDIGAGNANLSCLIALVLDVPVIAVEMESPRDELRGEAWLPEPLKSRGAVRRVESLIQDYDMPDGFNNALVLGKHLWAGHRREHRLCAATSTVCSAVPLPPAAARSSAARARSAQALSCLPISTLAGADLHFGGGSDAVRTVRRRWCGRGRRWRWRLRRRRRRRRQRRRLLRRRRC